ncbi:penicillin-binding protein 1C [Thalassoporum mexicanum]|uniref:penicillin-binding protein 1C n=1 Tax=Thalassoporum mexicanum TaxID=3457544 RepID=UPI0012EA88F2|nr:transglycosylase domain-containing protein [Pseudanabaena sp. PCC 7367]
MRIKGKRSRRQKFARFSARLLVSLVALFFLVRSLPYLAPIKAKDITQNQTALEFVDRNGLPLGTILTRDQEHTAVVDLDRVAPNFINAIIAAEDKRFYQHGAVDLRAIARATITAIRARRIISGASTITMQLARLLSDHPDRNLNNKLKEIWLAWRLAAGMSKPDILQAYINRLPMGGNVYGVEAAARLYFGLPASELNLAQATILAALPNDPVRLDPYTAQGQAKIGDRLKQRQRYILDRMVADHYIAPDLADRVAREQVVFQPLDQQGIMAAPHFLFWLADRLPANPAIPIHTTIDRELQEFTTAQIQQIVASLTAQNVSHAAALAIDNHTGEVLAYAGSTDYFAQARRGRNDGVQALRQPGSTLKPFLYQLALEKRLIQPNTILADVPAYYAIPGARLYNPIDYSGNFLGPVRVRSALANSLNIPAVRVLEKVGVANFLARLQQLGFKDLDRPANYYGLGLSLGSGEVSLWQLAGAYVTMARLGEPLPLSAVMHQSDQSADHSDETSNDRNSNRHNNRRNHHRSGQNIDRLGLNRLNQLNQSTNRSIKNINNQAAQSIDQPELPIAPDTWALIVNMLSDRHARVSSFGTNSALDLPFPAAVKTGTSSNFRDTWTVGFSQDYTVATWVGNFNGEPMRQVSGVSGAAPLWQRIMMHLYESGKYKNQQPQPFSPPREMVKKPICAISGAKPSPPCPVVVQEYLWPETLAEYENNADPFYELVSLEHGDRLDSLDLDQLESNTLAEYQLSLPPEYNEWLAQQSIASLINPTQTIVAIPHNSNHTASETSKLEQINQAAIATTTTSDRPESAELAAYPSNLKKQGLRIVSPRNDDYFVLDRIVAASYEQSQQSQQSRKSDKSEQIANRNQPDYLDQDQEQDQAQDVPAAIAAQKLEFKLARAPSQSVDWYLNGQKLATGKAQSVFWQLQPGEWQLEVASGDRRDQVSFTVELAPPPSLKRGFSIVK